MCIYCIGNSDIIHNNNNGSKEICLNLTHLRIVNLGPNIDVNDWMWSLRGKGQSGHKLPRGLKPVFFYWGKTLS